MLFLFLVYLGVFFFLRHSGYASLKHLLGSLYLQLHFLRLLVTIPFPHPFRCKDTNCFQLVLISVFSPPCWLLFNPTHKSINSPFIKLFSIDPTKCANFFLPGPSLAWICNILLALFLLEKVMIKGEVIFQACTANEGSKTQI